jgi:trans-2,3-dihydro-3-hydroxyanthranilate isomerase
MTELNYVIVDVFAQAALHGNPAAIVFDADGLSDTQMQALGREFNLSETAFILKPRDPSHTAQVRIFTPGNEVPFAGHPNIGAAFALARSRGLTGDDLLFDEKAGLVRLKLQRENRAVIGASLQAPRTLSTEPGPSTAATAAALSLQENDIVTTTHPPITASVGLEFLFVEVTDIAALARARAHIPAFDLIRASHRVEGVHLYAKSPTPRGARIQARNLSPYDGIGEDSATGSATASLVALLAERDPRQDCDFTLEAHQGLEIGRPSLLHGFAEKRGGKVAPPFVSGHCVQVMQGTILI